MLDKDILAIMKRRAEIRAEINELQSEIREAQDQISEFSMCKNAISAAAENWNNQYDAFQTIELAAVTVQAQFEGYSAKQISNKLLPVVEELNRSSILAKSVFPGIADQIEKLNKFIDEKQQQIDALNEELASLKV